MTRSVLLIDDDVQILGMLETAFRRAGYAVAAAASAEAGLAAYTRDAADLIILDLNLPDLPGLEVLARLRTMNPDVTVIVLTGQADLPTAVEAMRAGAENFLSKPMSLQHLYAAADRAFEKIELRSRASYLQRRMEEEGDQRPLGDSPAMRPVAHKISLVAPMDTSVLVLGETGTGKTWIARRIHALSPRAHGPFVEVNCASLSATFLESELFGHEKGAFTDAKSMKRGLFEVANEGTLFLDEIGDLAPDLQPKLLTVLESRRFRRLGGTRDIESDVRLILATNRDLQRAVAEGRFREDLYYRVTVMPIHLPALRERDRTDRERLALDLLRDIRGFTDAAAKGIAPEALRLIADYHWPGNIREMRNVLERALILAGNKRQIGPEHLPAEIAQAGTAQAGTAGGMGVGGLTGGGAASHQLAGGADAGSVSGGGPGDSQARGIVNLPVSLTLDELERTHIVRVIAHCKGNRSQAARMLGISRPGLYKKLRRFGLDNGPGGNES